MGKLKNNWVGGRLQKKVIIGETANLGKEVQFGCVVFERPVGHLCGKIKYAVEIYSSRNLVRVKNLAVISTEVTIQVSYVMTPPRNIKCKKKKKRKKNRTLEIKM